MSDRLAIIRERLHPTRAGYCAEPIDIEDARWLLAEVDRLRLVESTRQVVVRPPRTLDVIATAGCKVTTEKGG